jgi:hypothetical protein
MSSLEQDGRTDCAAVRRAHSTPDPTTPDPDLPPPGPRPDPDDVPAPARAPVKEPDLPEPPVKAQ